MTVQERQEEHAKREDALLASTMESLPDRLKQGWLSYLVGVSQCAAYAGVESPDDERILLEAVLKINREEAAMSKELGLDPITGNLLN